MWCFPDCGALMIFLMIIGAGKIKDISGVKELYIRRLCSSFCLTANLASIMRGFESFLESAFFSVFVLSGLDFPNSLCYR